MGRSLLVILLVFIIFHTQTLSAETYHASGTNPYFKDAGISLPAVPKSSSKDVAAECTSYSDFVTALRQAMENRVTSSTVHLVYSFLFSDITTILRQAIWAAAGSDDYTLFNYTGYNASWSGSNGNVTIAFTFSYLTTAGEEQYVSDRIARLLGQIITDEMTTLEKAKAVHDWIIRHVQYDYSLANHSAYDGFYRGTTVCNGYALMTYKMLRCLGMNVRIAYGLGNGGLHAWNLTYLNGNWFHMDCTWDDPNTQDSTVHYTYFNLSDLEITAKNHEIGHVYPGYDNFPDLPAAPVSFNETVYNAWIPTGQSPATPTLTSPASGRTDISLTPTLLTGVFSDPDIGDTHLKTLWQIATDTVFTECVYYDTSTASLTSLSIPAPAYLPNGTVCYWRVRFFDNNGNSSAWSPVYTFTTLTQNTSPDTPVLVSPDDGVTGLTETPTLASSEFSDSDRWDTHLKTQWQISTSSDFSHLVLDRTSTTSLTQLALSSGEALQSSTTHFWRVRYYDAHGIPSGWSAVYKFTTGINDPPDAPVPLYPVNPSSRVSLKPTLSAGAFSDPDSEDTHWKTQWQIGRSEQFYETLLDITSDTALIRYTLTDNDTLPENTTLFWRARYFDNKGIPSDWSETKTFTTITLTAPSETDAGGGGGGGCFIASLTE